ncbi:MAG: 4-(cytidine 5'-diphospho)-2-C-methyl-D-erythritol kinase, partial [Bacteroidales bacterium]|nr:4-(cytidine 5'-diphospho)-2-C-methyl-D-erythritol kinase [Bacteroidales bacterium]
SGIKAKNSENELIELIKKPIADWKNYIFNDFEIPVFKKFPELKAIKDDLYKSGAIYASMSGSGSSIFGIFDKKPEIPEKYQEYFVYTDEF